MNFLGIEMTMLILGIVILCYTFFNTVANILRIYQAIKSELSWKWNILPHIIISSIGILLVILSQLI